MLNLRDNWAELDADLDTSGAFRHAVRPSCGMGRSFASSGLSPDALIQTDTGERPARNLLAGDLVMTRDNGLQPLLWTGRSRDVSGDGPSPVRFKARHGEGAMLLAPGHLALLSHAKSDLLFGVNEVLARARDLVDLPGVTPAPKSAPAWVHLLFGAHELVRVAGIWAESLSPDMNAIEQSHPELADQIFEVAPRLRYAQGRAAYVYTRTVLDHGEVQLLISP